MDPVTIAKTAQIVTSLARSRWVRVLVVTVALIQLTAVLVLATLPGDLIAGLAGTREKQRIEQRAEDESCPAVGVDGSAAPERGFGGLSKDQVKHAHTIWLVGRSMKMGDRGAVVGIATAMQESTLRNINYGDRDSLGLFQQRPSMGWGTAKQVTNPRYAARKFFTALKGVHGWKSLPVTVAAQRVQRSAFPQAYAKHERTASGLVQLFGLGKTGASKSEVEAAVTSGMCAPEGGGDAMLCPASGLGVERGLTPDAVRVVRCVHKGWRSIRSIGGVGDRPSTVDDDHQRGRAVDVMIPNWRGSGKVSGTAIAAWAKKNHARLGVKYVIWDGRIWSVARAKEGWRSCASGSCYSGPNPTMAHRDHVHISVFGNRAASPGKGGGSVVRPVVKYTLTARFGQCSSRWAACHTGLDFAAGIGTPIRAVRAGTVTFVGWGGAYGNLTKISHGDGTASWYAHQIKASVSKGERVKAGQRIGYIGATGNVTGPHVHVEIRIRGRAIDPAAWLSARGARP